MLKSWGFLLSTLITIPTTIYCQLLGGDTIGISSISPDIAVIAACCMCDRAYASTAG